MNTSISPFLFAASISIACLSASTQASNWDKTLEEAEGQTVYFNAWGGSETINRYIEWASDEVKREYDLDVKHVKITDAGSAVTRIETEIESGNSAKGSIDLIWINGENFKRMKDSDLLAEAWANTIPNRAYVDEDLPVNVDFTVPVEGQESPWGGAQLTFMYNSDRLSHLPSNSQELLALANQQPGMLTYPRVPDFHATSFLKQLLIDLSNEDPALYQPVNDKEFKRLSTLLWTYLDQLHPNLWRNGQAFPPNIAQMHSMLADGELLLSISFNPNEAANLIRTGQLQPTTRSFGYERGMLGNIHFVAIPKNASAQAGAKVFADFLLSPKAQSHKADLDVWGDPSVLSQDKLNINDAQTLAVQDPSVLSSDTRWLSEPHSSWVALLEKAWLERYGAGKD